MAYERYIQKNGKVYGPYIYKSIRDKDGNVKNIYVGRGKHPEEKKNGFASRLFQKTIFPFRLRNGKVAVVFILAFISTTLLLAGLGSAVFDKITIQGQLRNSSNTILSGNYNFSFNIYSQASGGSSLYEKNITNLTVDSNGIYTAELTSLSLPFSQDYYLGVNVDSDGEMSPRLNLTDMGTAFRSNRSEYLGSNSPSYFLNTSAEMQTVGGNLTVSDALLVGSGGYPSGGITVYSTGNIFMVGNLTVDTSDFFIDASIGRVGIGTATPSEKLHLHQGNFLQTAGNPKLAGNFSNSTYLDGATSVYVSGKYAYVVSYNSDSLTVIDVSDPTSPTYVGNYSSGTYLNGPYSIYVSGKYAYVASSVSQSLTILDVSNPASPTRVGSYSNGTYLAGANNVYVSGRYAYVTSSSSSDSLTVIDVSNPTNPTYVGNYSSSFYMNGATGVYVSGKYAYVASITSQSLTVIDVSNPASPSYVSNYSSATYLNGANSVYVSGKYAYVTSTNGARFTVIDVSNPASPSYAGSYNSATYLNGIYSVYVSGRYAYVVSYTSNSLTVIDVSNPASPTYISNYSSGTYLNGAWSVYVSGKYAYVASWTSNSLTVLDISGIDAPAATIGDLAVGTIDVWENANIFSDLYVGSGLVVGPSGIYSQGNVTAPDIIASTGISIAGDYRTSWPSGGGNTTDEMRAAINGSDTWLASLGVGTASPDEKLKVDGNINVTGNITVGTGTIFIDGTYSRIGINTTILGRTLQVNGDASVHDQLISNQEGGLYFGRSRISENQLALNNDSFGNTWTSKASTENWYGVAMSSDGKYQTATINGAYLRVSTDYGNTWTPKGPNFTDWRLVAMSSDGKYQTAVAYSNDNIYVSTDYGSTWTSTASSENWFGVAMSSDGKYQTAVILGGNIYVSTDYGNTWTSKASSESWIGVAMSSDGKYQTATITGGNIYVSTDYGSTWTSTASSESWRVVTMSSDGKYQTAVIYGGNIYVSTDYGSTWTSTASSENWFGVAMSSDGKYQTAVIYGGNIYVSTDYGSTWTSKGNSGNWYSVAMSSDGKYQTVVPYGGNIYVSYTDSYIYGGNIGIGTMDPNATLHVSGNITATNATVDGLSLGGTYRTTWPTGGGNTTAEIWAVVDNDTFLYTSSTSGEIDFGYYTYTGTLGGGNITAASIGASQLAPDSVADSELMNSGDWVITGNLNIGTNAQAMVITTDGYLSDEDDPLTVSDSLYVIGNDIKLKASTSGGMKNFSILDYNLDTAGFRIRYDDSTGATYLENLYNNAAGDLYIRTKADGAPVDAIFIESAGNVGIGNTGPDAELHVQGGACIDTDAACTDPGDGNLTAHSLIASTGIDLAGDYRTSWPTGGGNTTSEIWAVVDNETFAKLSEGFSYTNITDEPWQEGTELYNTTAEVRAAINGSDSWFNNVGIGTASPGSYNAGANNLVVYENGDAGITIASGTTDNGYLLFADGTVGGETYRGGVVYYHTAATERLALFSGSGEKLTILSGGNVGIGNTGPDAELHVQGGACIDTDAACTDPGDGNLTAHSLIASTGIDLAGDYRTSWPTGGNVNGSDININSLEVNKKVNLSGSLFTNESGKVGIGTASPISKLHVNGTLRWGGSSAPYIFSGEDASGLYIEQQGTTTANEDLRIQSSESGDTTNYSIFTIDPTDGFAFTTIGTGNGNVGIGDTSPDELLHLAKDDAALVIARGTGDYGLRILEDFTAGGLIKFQVANDSAQGWRTFMRIEEGVAADADRDLILVEEAGNVGINTTNPEYVLDVRSAGVGIAHQNYDGALRVWTQLVSDDGLLAIRDTSNATKVALLSDGDSYFKGGNVGIGTTTPAQKLHVYEGGVNVSNSQNGTMLYVDNATGYVGIGTDSPAQKLSVNIEDNYDGISLSRGSTSLFLVQKSGGAENTSYLSMLSLGATTVRIHANGSSYFTGGNVGIGTDSPDTNLHIWGGDSESPNMYITVNDTTGIPAFWLANNYSGTPNYGGMGLTTGNILAFSTTGSFGTAAIYINDTNVGIGTTSPTNPLDVKGIIQITPNTGTQKYGLYSYNNVFQINPRNADGSFMGVQGITMNITGLVGIGTTTPSKELEVSDGTYGITFDPNDGSASTGIINTTGGTNLTIHSSGGNVIIKLGQ